MIEWIIEYNFSYLKVYMNYLFVSLLITCRFKCQRYFWEIFFLFLCFRDRFEFGNHVTGRRIDRRHEPEGTGIGGAHVRHHWRCLRNHRHSSLPGVRQGVVRPEVTFGAETRPNCKFSIDGTSSPLMEKGFRQSLERYFWKEHYSHAKTINVELETFVWTIFFENIFSPILSKIKKILLDSRWECDLQKSDFWPPVVGSLNREAVKSCGM